MTELEEFITRVLTTPLKLDLVLYFHRNPYTMDYAEGTAQRLGVDPELVAIALQELTQAGVLDVRQSQFNASRPPVYRYTRQEKVRALVNSLDQQVATGKDRQNLLARLGKT